METLRVEFLGGPRDGAEIPPRYLIGWAVGNEFMLDDCDYCFEEMPGGRRVARFLGYTQSKRSS